MPGRGDHRDHGGAFLAEQRAQGGLLRTGQVADLGGLAARLDALTV